MVLVGFWTVSLQLYNQAKLFEKALSGIDTMSRESTQGNLKTRGGKKSQLAPDPKPAPPPPEPKSGINVVILFDLPDDVALRRSAGRTCELTYIHFKSKSFFSDTSMKSKKFS